MRSFGKKALCLLLTLAMLLPASAVGGQATSEVPVIYVGDISDNTLYSYPDSASLNPVFPQSEEELKSCMFKIVAGLLVATIGGDSALGTDYLLQGLNGLLRDILCDEYGESEDYTLGVNTYRYPIAAYKQTNNPELYTAVLQALGDAQDSVGLDDTYFFTYDWRMDPIANAAKLNDFIQHVKAEEGVSRVSLLCAGNGGVIGNAYLYSYEDNAARDIVSCVFLHTPFNGNSIVGDIMTGNLTDKLVDAGTIMDMYEIISGTERANAMVRYVNDDPQGIILQLFKDTFGESPDVHTMNAFIIGVVNMFLNAGDVYAEIAKTYNQFISQNEAQLLSGHLMTFLRNTPGMWALVPEDNFDDAWNFMFPDGEVSAKLSKKINDFRAVLENTKQTLQTAKKNRINVCVVASYNMQILPITGTIDEHSDSFLLTSSASAGATTVKVASSKVLSQSNKDGHRHLSPCDQIDASTCALPESTWLFKSLPNMRFFCETAADFVVWMLNGTNKTHRSVWQNELYPQYMGYSRQFDGKIYALANGSKAYYLGDADMDGEVNAADARMALRTAVKLEIIDSHIGQQLADVDGDKQITASDARGILRMSVGLPLA